MNKIKKEFQDNGYVIIKNFFSKKKCEFFLKKISKYADKNFSAILNPDRQEYLISQSVHLIEKEKYLGDKCDLVYDIKKDCKFFRKQILNKKILKILRSIKGRKVNGLMSQMLFKKSKTKSAKQSWLPHQDSSYVGNTKGEYITTNIFMHNANKLNGTLFIYEKSHLNGVLEFNKKISYREKNNRPGNLVKNLSKFKKKDLYFKKGDMLILHGDLIHGSYENKSNRSRSLYSMSYIAEGEYFTAGLNARRKILN